MEVFEKIQNNLDIIDDIDIKDMFPQTIYYPGQLENFENKKIISLTNSNSNGDIINLNNTGKDTMELNKTLSPNNTKEEFDSIMNISYNDNENNKIKQKNLVKSLGFNLNKNKKIKDIKNFKKLTIPRIGEIWDIILDEDILAVCGKFFIKVFKFKKYKDLLKSKGKDINSNNPNDSNNSNNTNNDLNEKDLGENHILKSEKFYDIENEEKEPKEANNIENNNFNDIHMQNDEEKNQTEKEKEKILLENVPEFFNKFTSFFFSKKNPSNNLYDLFSEEIFFEDSNEEFYCMEKSSTNHSYSKKTIDILAVGGTGCIIKIIDLSNKKPYRKLIGHRNDIYDLKFYPNDGNILLSASKDNSIRLWNITNCLQIGIFAGPKGHSADVLSIDWHLSGEYFVSSGIDNTIKIWQIYDDMSDNIKLSYKFVDKKTKIDEIDLDNLNPKDSSKDFEFEGIGSNSKGKKARNSKTPSKRKNKKDFETKKESKDSKHLNSNNSNKKERNSEKNSKTNPINLIDLTDKKEKEKGNQKPKKHKFSTIITTKCIFSTRTVHENYVDSVKFNGNFVISKSVDGVIREWMPVFNKESDFHYIINTYTYDTKEYLWYVRLTIDPERRFIATGNSQGKLFIFNINEDTNEEMPEDMEFDYFYNNTHDYVVNTGVKKLVRSVKIFGNLIALGNSDGSIYLAKMK